MRISARIIYYPLLTLYAIGPLIHDFIPNYSMLGVERGAYFALFYLVGLLVLLPILLYVKRVESKNINLTLGIGLRLALGLGIYVVPYIFFWSDWPLFHISLVISLYASFFSMVAFRTLRTGQLTLLREVGGTCYIGKDGALYPLAEGKVDATKSYGSVLVDSVTEFSSKTLGNNEYQSSGNNHTNYNGADSAGFVINPASGMPTVGGISGLDIHGNSWGTNFNEPSNTYDPNRGY